MKKTILLGILLILVASMTYAAVFNSVDDAYQIIVTMINQEPDPVAPGNMVDVRFRIENNRAEVANNVEVKLVPKFPFTIYWQDEEIQNIGSLSPGQSGEAGVRVKYRLVVDPNAATGENEVEFIYRINGGPWTKAGEYTISVRTQDAVLAINEIKTDSDEIMPGTTTKVTFRLENLADNLLQNIKLKLDVYSATVTTTGIVYTELPFTPIGSGNEKTLDRISPKKSNEISFNLFTDADAESKVYKVPYVLSYSDEGGSNFTRSGVLGLMVDAEPEVSINLDRSEIYSAGTRGTVSIKFVNKGFSDVKFLDLVLEETDQFDLLSNPEVYIGNVDSDDYETADYELLVFADSKSPVILPLSYEYRDANGQLYRKEKDLELELFAGKELKQRVGNGNQGFVGIIIVIVIIIAGIIVYRVGKKRKWFKK